MKVHIDFDITATEVRKIMGLPDLEPLQKDALDKIKVKMDEYFNNISDPETMFQKLMPMGIQAMENYQNFFQEMAKASTTSGNSEKND